MKRKKVIYLILSGLFFLNILAWIGVYEISGRQFLEVIFFDVGQGDAIFIETPEHHQILIDGGPNSTILEKIAKEMPFWDKTIDLVILTHPESDHLTGLIEVLKTYKIENILWTGVIRDTAEYKEWEKLIKNENAKIYIAQSSQKIKWSRNVRDYLEILWPSEILEGREFKDSNNTSIVAKLVFDENSFLFTGDIYSSAERKLIEKKKDIDCDVLKISHHGSKTSNSEEFIESVSPQYAIISVGKNNSYGHPHQEVLDTLTEYGITILRTDKDGDIKIISDGKYLKIVD